MKVLQSEYLEFVDGTSDKFYRVEVREEDDGSWSTVATYGKRGAPKPQSTAKYQGDDRTKASDAFAKALAEKTRGGYKPANEPRA